MINKIKIFKHFVRIIQCNSDYNEIKSCNINNILQNMLYIGYQPK